MMRTTILSLVLAALLTDGERAREMRLAMGTFAEIQVSGAESPERAIAAAFARIDALERLLSVWRDDSEVSRLNRESGGTASEDLLFVLENVVEIGRASSGAFDVTLEPSGYERIRVDRAASRVSLEGVKLDLGSIAKGFAVDAALQVLQGAGATAALVDLGTSSIGVFGDEPVTFEIRSPRGRLPPATFQLYRGAVGSSSRDQAGGHILDPRTGNPAGRLLAVTVVAESAFEADALSTAVFVLGEKDGLALLERRGASGIVVLEEGSDLVLSATPGFAERHGLVVARGVRLR